MPISERIEGTLESWSGKWKDRLKGWASGVIGFGVEVFMDALGKSFSKKLEPFINLMEATEGLPDEIRPLLDEVLNPTGESAGAIANNMSQAVVGGAVGRMLDAVLLPLAYAINSKTQNVIFNPTQMVELYYRGVVSKDILYLAMKQHGYSNDSIDKWVQLREVRLPSEVVGPIWLRDKAKWEEYWNDVRQQGITEDRIDLFKELAYQVPNVQDVIRFAVREAYTPEIAEKFGQYADDPTTGSSESAQRAQGDIQSAGIRPQDFPKYWAAHWDLPSISQAFEIYHRGLLGDPDSQEALDTLNLLLRAQDVMPFWRDKLIGISWNLPNRIETRMMARYGIVNKTFIVEILTKLGLAKEYREVVADMNIAMGIRSDLATRYSKKWINKDEVKAELEASGLSSQVQDRLYKWIVSNTAPERTATERDLTQAQIIKAVKKGVIPWDDGLDRLMELGYDEEEAIIRMTTEIELVEEAPTTALSVQVDTIRRQRRQRLISRDQEIAALLNLGLEVELATAYADNDDLRLIKETS